MSITTISNGHEIIKDTKSLPYCPFALALPDYNVHIPAPYCPFALALPDYNVHIPAPRGAELNAPDQMPASYTTRFIL